MGNWTQLNDLGRRFSSRSGRTTAPRELDRAGEELEIVACPRCGGPSTDGTACGGCLIAMRHASARFFTAPAYDPKRSHLPEGIVLATGVAIATLVLWLYPSTYSGRALEPLVVSVACGLGLAFTGVFAIAWLWIPFVQRLARSGIAKRFDRPDAPRHRGTVRVEPGEHARRVYLEPADGPRVRVDVEALHAIDADGDLAVIKDGEEVELLGETSARPSTDGYRGGVEPTIRATLIRRIAR
ncbi:MAG: hypothetical protein AB7S26_18425 [Sandaracinaceae bacterium]